MAMTLRLRADEDRALALLARAHGCSKQEAARRAIISAAARMLEDEQVHELAQQRLAEYRDIAQRLHPQSRDTPR